MNRDIYNKIKEYYSIELRDYDESIKYYNNAQLDTLTKQDWEDFKKEYKNNNI